MEFWATEVRSGETFKVKTGLGMVLHLSQANLGELKKDKSNESVILFVNVNEKKLVLGTLSADKLPQQQFDLVFDQDFELSHNLKSGSVYFFGYKAANRDEDEIADYDSDSEEDIPLAVENNGKPDVTVKEVKATEAKKPAEEKAKKKENTEKVANVLKSEDEDDSDDSDDDDTDMDEDEDDSDSEDEDDSEEEETPVKAEPAAVKKRSSSEAEPVTPAANKKVKVTTPQKTGTDGKKGGTAHVATPHPSKQAVKTPANQNQKTPKSGGGSHVCKTCSRTFGSEGGLDSHTKAKHSAAK